MGTYYLDFVGLNTVIYEPITYTEDDWSDPAYSITIGATGRGQYETHFTGELTRNNFGHNSFFEEINYIGWSQFGTLAFYKNGLSPYPIPGPISNPAIFPALMLRRNGPYGWPTWKQIRVGQNPLTRKQIKENIFTYIREPGDPIVIDGSNTNHRRGRVRQLIETPVISRYRPLMLRAGSSGGKLEIKTSLGNSVCHFNNQELDKHYGVDNCSVKDYKEVKNLYLDGALDDETTPLDEFGRLIYAETIYPNQIYSNKSYTRQRTSFYFNWRDVHANRVDTSVDNMFGKVVGKQSIWPLDWDVSQGESGGNSRTGSYYGINNDDYGNGILQNNYSQIANLLSSGPKSSTNINLRLQPGPRYARLHTLTPTMSVVSPNGMEIDGITYNKGAVSTINSIYSLPSGDTKWEAGDQAGKNPFYDSYDDYIQGPRQRGKGYTIVPEFRISNHIEDIVTQGLDSKFPNMFEMTGGLTSADGSDSDNFYEIYSTSDFLKHFDLIVSDHRKFVDPINIKLKCKAIKKFLPYNGFYPCQRTVDMAEQFFSSYSSSITTNNETGGFNPYASSTQHGFQNLLNPLFAPGTLFNSIKSGVACDYPITDTIVSGDQWTAVNHGENHYIGGNRTGYTLFPTRIPFKALVEPERYLSNRQLFCQEAHTSSNSFVSAFWDGTGDYLYKMMAHNFLAEVPNFFLEGSQFTALHSMPSDHPTVGNATAGKVYSMRVKMYKTSDTPIQPIRSSSAGEDQWFIAPQYADDVRENFTMYSRPSAFGPPTRITGSLFGGAVTGSNSDAGENYPFTPPYYYGQSWADIKFIATETKKYSLLEIMESASVHYWRYTHEDTGGGAASFSDTGDRAGRINTLYNNNAMQLSASVNLFASGEVQMIDLTDDSTSQKVKVMVDIADQEKSRWIIQSYFETPMLNFNHLSSSASVYMPTYGSESISRGMWHQYGNIETDASKGVFLQITDIPKDWQNIVSGSTEEKSLASLCGFTTSPNRLGRVAGAKVIREAVVAIPFIERDNKRQFFKIERSTINLALQAEAIAEEGSVGKSILDMVYKMERYVIPPSLDFVHRSDIDPFAMYIFEFTHKLTQQDISDIWQNLPPTVGQSFEEVEVSLSHKLLAHELLGGGELMKEQEIKKGTPLSTDIKWMVFKVKQRGETNYYNKIVGEQDSSQQAALASTFLRPPGIKRDVSYNWPYDFFSLVELVKLDTEVTMADPGVSFDDDVVPIRGQRAINSLPMGARQRISGAPSGGGSTTSTVPGEQSYGGSMDKKLYEIKISKTILVSEDTKQGTEGDPGGHLKVYMNRPWNTGNKAIASIRYEEIELMQGDPEDTEYEQKKIARWYVRMYFRRKSHARAWFMLDQGDGRVRGNKDCNMQTCDYTIYPSGLNISEKPEIRLESITEITESE